MDPATGIYGSLPEELQEEIQKRMSLQVSLVSEVNIRPAFQVIPLEQCRLPLQLLDPRVGGRHIFVRVLDLIPMAECNKKWDDLQAWLDDGFVRKLTLHGCHGVWCNLVARYFPGRLWLHSYVVQRVTHMISACSPRPILKIDDMFQLANQNRLRCELFPAKDYMPFRFVCRCCSGECAHPPRWGTSQLV